MRPADRAVSPDPAAVAHLIEPLSSGGDKRTAESARRTLGLLRTSSAPFSRSEFDPGHVTASALVVSPDRGRVLLIHHERLGRWLQPGGHLEPNDVTAAAAARRELREETGLMIPDDRGAVLVAVDVHRIPAARGEPEHWHHDLMFYFPLRDGVALPEDGPAVRWCALGDLEGLGADLAVQRGVARALELTSSEFTE